MSHCVEESVEVLTPDTARQLLVVQMQTAMVMTGLLPTREVLIEAARACGWAGINWPEELFYVLDEASAVFSLLSFYTKS